MAANGQSEKTTQEEALTLSPTKRREQARLDFYKSVTQELDDYSALTFTPEEIKKVRTYLSVYKTGAIAALPVQCNPPKCQIAQAGKCVFYNMGKAPEGLSCLLETNLAREWRMWYLEEYQVNPESFTEISLVNELAEIELLNWRLNNQLATPEHATLIQENVVALDKEGNPVIQVQISAVLEAKERLLTRKNRLIKLMVGDRQEKYKREAALKIRESKDPSESMAQIRFKLEQLQRDITHQEIEIQKKAGVIIEAGSSSDSPLRPEDILRQEE